jgi:hypothetical protein
VPSFSVRVRDLQAARFDDTTPRQNPRRQSDSVAGFPAGIRSSCTFDVLDAEAIFLGIREKPAAGETAFVLTKAGRRSRAQPREMLHDNAGSRYPRGREGRYGEGTTSHRSSCLYQGSRVALRIEVRLAIRHRLPFCANVTDEP